MLCAEAVIAASIAAAASEAVRNTEIEMCVFSNILNSQKGTVGYLVVPSTVAPTGAVTRRTGMGTTFRLVGGLLELV